MLTLSSFLCLARLPLLFLFFLGLSAMAQQVELTSSADGDLLGSAAPAPISFPKDLSLASTSAMPAEPIRPVVGPEPPPGVNWAGLTKDSLRFLTVMQAFRAATEPGTRDAFTNPWFKGWLRSVANMHGFSDGDPFVVNYVGHPLQGAVAGYIWNNNDGAYQKVYFSQDPQYWKSKLRGTAFSYVYSLQFEIGPVSEASIGDVQSYYPAQGFVDHVITPVVGTGWSIGEDAVDRYLIRSLEHRTHSRFWRAMARSFLNPARSFANLMAVKYPWDRSNRPIISAYDSAGFFEPVLVQAPQPPPGVAPFEFHGEATVKTYLGSGSQGNCVGGGAGIGFRIAAEWQIVSSVNGCKLTGMARTADGDPHTEVSGDSLTYVIGPRWSRRSISNWTMHAQFMVGGNKITQEHVDPEKKELAELAMQTNNVWPPMYSEFARSWDSNAFALSTGGGVARKLNNALSFRLALDYSHTWNPNLNGTNYRNSIQISSGFVLSMGTW